MPDNYPACTAQVGVMRSLLLYIYMYDCYDQKKFEWHFGD